MDHFLFIFSRRWASKWVPNSSHQEFVKESAFWFCLFTHKRKFRPRASMDWTCSSVPRPLNQNEIGVFWVPDWHLEASLTSFCGVAGCPGFSLKLVLRNESLHNFFTNILHARIKLEAVKLQQESQSTDEFTMLRHIWGEKWFCCHKKVNWFRVKHIQ